jgi:membrane-associated protease RseP (regulator of RpoE activity)
MQEGRAPRGWAVLVAALALVAGTASAAAPPKDRAAAEKELADARARLDAAARDVAELSQQLYGDQVQEVVKYIHGPGPQGAMLGVNIGGDQARDEGVEVMGVSPSGPAQAAGLRTGDVIIAVDGTPLKKAAEHSPSRQLVEYMRSVQPGQTVKLDYLRDGKRLTAAIDAAPAEPPMIRIMRERHGMPGPDGPMPPGSFETDDFDVVLEHGPAFGQLELVAVTPKLGQYFGTDKGLLVVRAPADGAFKLEDGDVIFTIGGRVPGNPGHAFRILGSYQPGEIVKFDIQRNRKRMTVDGVVPKESEAGHVPMQPHRVPPAPPAPPPPKSGAA